MSPPSEMVHIDGQRNPELIPEWNAWASAFRSLRGNSKESLPTAVLLVASDQEAAALLGGASQHARREIECQQRVLALRPLLDAGKVREVNTQTKDILLDCRWQTLRARDRLMTALGEKPRAALEDFVALMRAATRLTIRKQELDFFRQPR